MYIQLSNRGSLVSLGKYVAPLKFLGGQSAAQDQTKDIDELVESTNSSNHFHAMAFVNAVSGNPNNLSKSCVDMDYSVLIIVCSLHNYDWQFHK